MASLVDASSPEGDSPSIRMTEKQLGDFLRIAMGTIAQPDLMKRLGSAVMGAPATERGALVEQVLAREYELIWMEIMGKGHDGASVDKTGLEAVRNEMSKEPYMTVDEWTEYSKTVCGDEEDDPRGDKTLLDILDALDHHVNQNPSPHAAVLTDLWTKVQLMEERLITRAHLKDDEFQRLLSLDETCEKKVKDYGAELWQEIPMSPPQKRVQIIQSIKKAGADALTAKAPNFNELTPSERQTVMESMSLEERDPILRMNALREVMHEMQRMQMIGQQLVQQYISVIPQMDVDQQKAQHDRLQAKAMEVLPEGFMQMTVEEKQKAVNSVRGEKKMPVMKWNSMCMALQILANSSTATKAHGHGHSHGAHEHGHSHGAQEHGHSHGAHGHGHSHGAHGHGHSH